MQTVIIDGKVTFTVDAFLNTLSLEDKFYLAQRAIYDKDVMERLVCHILNGPPIPSFHEARMMILENMDTPFRTLVKGLMSKIEALTRNLQQANSRALKYYYAWPTDRIADRPKHVPFEAEIPIPDSDLDAIIKTYFEKRKNGISNGS